MNVIKIKSFPAVDCLLIVLVILNAATAKIKGHHIGLFIELGKILHTGQKIPLPSEIFLFNIH